MFHAFAQLEVDDVLLSIKDLRSKQVDLSPLDLTAESALVAINVICQNQRLNENAELTLIDVGYNKLNRDHSLRLLEAMEGMKMTNICLAGCNLGASGARKFEMLGDMSKLTELSLRKTSLKDEGARAVAKALRICHGLTSLDMGNNQIGAEGAKEIAAAIAHSRVETLDLSMNNLGPQGTKHVAQLLHTTTSLLKVDLAFNHVTCFGNDSSGLVEMVKATLSLVGRLNAEQRPTGNGETPDKLDPPRHAAKEVHLNLSSNGPLSKSSNGLPNRAVAEHLWSTLGDVWDPASAVTTKLPSEQDSSLMGLPHQRRASITEFTLDRSRRKSAIVAIADMPAARPQYLPCVFTLDLSDNSLDLESWAKLRKQEMASQGAFVLLPAMSKASGRSKGREHEHGPCTIQ